MNTWNANILKSSVFHYLVFVTVYIPLSINFTDLPHSITGCVNFRITKMSTRITQHYVTISKIPPGRAVSVQWTAFPEVPARTYSTPSYAALDLGWFENQAIEAMGTNTKLGTFTPIDYDLIGQRSIQGEFDVLHWTVIHDCD